MRNTTSRLVAGVLSLSLMVAPLYGCGGSQSQDTGDASQETVEAADATEDAAEDAAAEEATDATEAQVADGEYAIEVKTDSSMFRAESCTLKVVDGAYTAVLSLPGEGFSRLYFGTAEDAVTASDEDVYDYYLNDDGLYTFDVPVEALGEELPIAAFGQRRDTWYDHTIVFHAPSSEE